MTEEATSNLTDAEYWDKQRPESVRRIAANHLFAPYVTDILPVNPEWDCLEVGAVPGGILLWMAKALQYKPVALDFSSQVHQLREAYAEHGIEGEFLQEDFLNWRTDRQFDVVMSCGFIEHFKNYPEIVRLHWNLVRPGGYMLLSVPTLTLVQMWIRKRLYMPGKMQEVLDSHVLEVMGLKPLLRAVEQCPGAEVRLARYILEMKVWFRPGEPGIRTDRPRLYSWISRVERAMQRRRISSRFFSPMAMVLVQKPKTR